MISIDGLEDCWDYDDRYMTDLFDPNKWQHKYYKKEKQNEKESQDSIRRRTWSR
jgi:hypothetical protein